MRVYMMGIYILYVIYIYCIYGSEGKYSMAHFSGSTERNCTIFGQYGDLMIKKHFLIFWPNRTLGTPFILHGKKHTFL